VAERILSLIVVIFTTLLAYRLYSGGLSRKYPAFFSYLLFSAVQNAALLIPNKTGNAYFWTWVATEPIAWFFYVLMFLELYSMITSAHEGIRSVGRTALYVAVGAALAVSVVVSIPFNAPVTHSRVLSFFYLAERTINISLVTFLAVVLFMMMRYPIALSRNVIIHSIVYSFYFLSNTVVFLALSLLGFGEHTAGYAVSLLSVAAIMVWLTKFDRAGEAREQRLAMPWMAGHEEELIGQLNEINRVLMKVSKNNPG